MTAESSMLQLLQQWQEWTLAEAEALRAQDWNRVAACQEAKKTLRVFPQFQSTLTRTGTTGLARQLAEQLIMLETANRDWVASQAAALKARLSELSGSSRNLARLRGSYACHKRSCWQSYS